MTMSTQPMPNLDSLGSAGDPLKSETPPPPKRGNGGVHPGDSFLARDDVELDLRLSRAAVAVRREVDRVPVLDAGGHRLGADWWSLRTLGTLRAGRTLRSGLAGSSLRPGGPLRASGTRVALRSLWAS